jgi:hypothetical protein
MPRTRSVPTVCRVKKLKKRPRPNKGLLCHRDRQIDRFYIYHNVYINWFVVETVFNKARKTNWINCQAAWVCRIHFYPTYFCQENRTKWKLPPYLCGSDVSSQIQIRYSAVVRHWIQKWEYNEAVQWLFIDLDRAYDSEVLYKFLVEFACTIFKYKLPLPNTNTE